MSNWKTACCYLQGSDHKVRGTACQDMAAVWEKDNYIAAALADGLGSLPYSEMAANQVVQTTVNWLLRQEQSVLFGETAKKAVVWDLFPELEDRIKACAEEAMVDYREMDCNLVFVLVDKSLGKALIGHLGDCAVCMIGLNPLAHSQPGDLANSTATVMGGDIDQLKIFQLDLAASEVRSLVLTSDGLEGVVYRKGSHYVYQRTAELVNIVVSLEAGQANDELCKAVEAIAKEDPVERGDDISLVVITCEEKPIHLPSDPTWLCTCGRRNPITESYCSRCAQERMMLYPDAAMKQYMSRVKPQDLEYVFRYLNDNPDQEQALLYPDGKAAEKSAQKQDTKKQPAKPVQKSGLAALESLSKEYKQSEKKPLERKTEKTEKREKSGKTEKHSGLSRVMADNSRLMGDDAADQRDSRYSQQNSEKRGRRARSGKRMDDYRTVEDERAEMIPGLSPGAIAGIVAGAVALVLMLALMLYLFFGGSSRKSGGWERYQGYEYSGQIMDGKPNGCGILKRDGYYWIGEFQDGEMVGRFYVVNIKDAKDARTEELGYAAPTKPTVPPETERPAPTEKTPENTQGEEPVQQQTEAAQPVIPTGETFYILNPTKLREKPKTASAFVDDVLLAQNEKVTVLEGPVDDGRGGEWYKIATMDGKVGYVTGDNLGK